MTRIGILVVAAIMLVLDPCASPPVVVTCRYECPLQDPDLLPWIVYSERWFCVNDQGSEVCVHRRRWRHRAWLPTGDLRNFRTVQLSAQILVEDDCGGTYEQSTRAAPPGAAATE